MAKFTCLSKDVFLATAVCVMVICCGCGGSKDFGEIIFQGYVEDADYGKASFKYPLEGALFPPELPAPKFVWEDDEPEIDLWWVMFRFTSGNEMETALTTAYEWTPGDEQWEEIKSRSSGEDVSVTVLGVNKRSPGKIVSKAKTTFAFSQDEVGAPIFYRDVNLPFIEAVKDPSDIRWRMGLVSSVVEPPVVLENLPVCGNCHSFSADGKFLGMDVDYGNDKGSYAIVPVEEEMVLSKEKVITWSDYKRDDGDLTFGLLSQISPDGRYIVGTVKDRSVFVPKPDLAFSQLFFPIRGILCIYDTTTKTFASLPGADDPEYVQSNPSWSQDGKHIVFARSKAYRLKEDKGKVLLGPEEVPEFLQEGKTFLFDLYRIPFNDGKGGEPQAIPGASNNGMSNFFGRYSPDGKWMVFCKAKSYMLLQPDSELYIIPAEGGEAKRLEGNTGRMNSWHSWSPNGKWLVFSSKVNTPYTQLFLTHINEEGRSSPPVLLSRFTAPERAANIPEFVGIAPDAVKRIKEGFLDDVSFFRAGNELAKSGEIDAAVQKYMKALELNPKHVESNYNVGLAMELRGKPDEAIKFYEEALRLNPKYAQAHSNLGLVLLQKGQFEPGLKHLASVVDIAPADPAGHLNLGIAYTQMNKTDAAVRCFKETIRLKPDMAQAHYHLGTALASKEMHEESVQHLKTATELDTKNIDAFIKLGHGLARLNRFEEAAGAFARVLEAKPDDAQSRYSLARSLVYLQRFDEALLQYNVVVERSPKIALDPTFPVLLGIHYSRAGMFDKAIESAEKAQTIARNAGNQRLVEEIQRHIQLYTERKPYENEWR